MAEAELCTIEQMDKMNALIDMREDTSNAFNAHQAIESDKITKEK